MSFVPSTVRTVGFQPGERNIFLHVLTACNLRCRHCYINPEQHGSNTLPLETAQAWLQTLARPEQEKPDNLIVLGGEPTLYPQLPELIRTAKGLNYAITVDTNGYLLNDFLDHIGPNDVDVLSFSLDGPTPVVNDALRGQGVFSTCTENIRRARDLGFSLSLIYTVSAHNIDYLPEMPALLADLGIKRFFIQVIGLRGQLANTGETAPEAGAWQVASEKWLAIVPQVAEEAARQGIHVTWPKVFLDPEESFECAGLVADNYFIFPNGRVYRCPLCEDYPIHSYKMRDNQLVKRQGLLEDRFFTLSIPEGCVMNKLLQAHGSSQQNPLAEYRVSCCLLKQEIVPT